MQQSAPAPFIAAPHWWAILLSLATTTVGWIGQLYAWVRADTIIMAGTALVMVSVMLALRRIARQVGLPIAYPLCMLSVGLLLLVLEPLCQSIAAPATVLFRLLVEIMVALGVIRLLLNLNKVLTANLVAKSQSAHLR